MPSPRRTWIIAAALAFSCGCSQNNDAFKNATAPPDGGLDAVNSDASVDAGVDTHAAIDPTLADTQQKLVNAECQLMSRCCTADELRNVFGVDGVNADCTDFQSAVPTTIHLGNLTNSIEAGRIKFDPDMAQLCHDAYLSQDCADWTTLSPAQTTLTGCMEMLVPQVEADGQCKFDYECIDGYCKQPQDGGDFGTCTPYAGADEPCFGANCAEGFYCDEFADACIAQKDVGAACLDDGECKSGHCVSDADGNMTCGVPSPLCTSSIDAGQ